LRGLIINADGYGFTGGITRAIEECIDFGTVRSVSANVNFPGAERLRDLVRRYPFLSVGCHLNPIVGRPVLPAREIPSLVDRDGNFLYKGFARKFQSREMDIGELRAELMAQVERTRDLASDCFSHVDFHMGLHKLPRLYPIFLQVAAASGTGRIRTHRYLAGIESRHPRFRHATYMFESLDRLPKYLWNLFLRRWARLRGFAMPDYGLEITHMGSAGSISVANYLNMVKNVPNGYCEFIAHPAYVDSELRRWSTYVEGRVAEREVLLNPRFREALLNGSTQLAGYRDIPAGRPKTLQGDEPNGRSAASANGSRRERE
jgi:chitin disaccharide deacetylase